MGELKKKLTAAQKAVKKMRKQEYLTIFVGGKQKRVKRAITIDGTDVDGFILNNADQIWLHQNEMWEYIESSEGYCNSAGESGPVYDRPTNVGDDEPPF
jgi:hypothetical protein